MKTPYGYLHFDFQIRGGWAQYLTQLRTYRNKLLFLYGDVLTGLHHDGKPFDIERNLLRYEKEYFLKQAEPIAFDKVKLCEVLTPCFNWNGPDKTILTADSDNWAITLRLGERRVSFSYDTYTDEYDALVSRLEAFIQRPIVQH